MRALREAIAAGLTVRLPGSGTAAFTTRGQGNMSLVAGDGHERGRENQERLREQLGLGRLVRGYQVHGTTVRRIHADADLPALDAPLALPPEADGHATLLAGVGVVALAADCLPVALGSEGAVAMVHAGWRGLAAGVLEEGVRALRDLDPAGEITAVVGPAAGRCCYEVGEEVHVAFNGAHRSGRNIDLGAIARDRLRAAGVAEVKVVAACTICDERFFSYRREGAQAGRQAGVAWLS